MRKRILLVDDEPGIRLLLAEILKNEGYETAEAITGEEVFDKLADTSFDLLILDYKLPVLDGVDVVKQLQEKRQRIPCIMMTGLIEMVEDKVAHLELVKGILAKPFHIEELCRKVKCILAAIPVK